MSHLGFRYVEMVLVCDDLAMILWNWKVALSANTSRQIAWNLQSEDSPARRHYHHRRPIWASTDLSSSLSLVPVPYFGPDRAV